VSRIARTPGSDTQHPESASQLRPGKDSLSEARRKRKVSRREERRKEVRTGKARRRKAAAASPDGASFAVSMRQGSGREEAGDSGIRMTGEEEGGGEEIQVEEEQEEDEEEDLPVLSMGAPEGETMAPLNSTLPSEAILRPFWDTSGKVCRHSPILHHQGFLFDSS
jgi:hypothetical protein